MCRLKTWIQQHRKCAISLCIISAICLFAIILLWQPLQGVFVAMKNIITPFVIGVVLAYLLRPVYNFAERILNKIAWLRRFPGAIHLISLVFAYITGIGVLALVLLTLLPPLTNSITNLLRSLPERGRDIATTIDRITADNPWLHTIVDEISKRAETMFNTELIPSVTEIVDVIVAGAKGAFDALKNLFIGIIVSVYLLGDKARISKIAGSIIDRYASPAQSAAIREEIKFADKTMTKYLAGTLLDALLVGIITYVFALITRLPSPLVLAAIIAVTNVIPIVGPFIGAIPTIFLVLAYTPEKLLMYCIYLLILQQLDGHVFVPKVLGSAVGISGLSALFAIIAGGELFGIAGMILGVPVITIVFDIIKKVHATRMSHKETKDLSMQGGEE